MIFVSLSKDVPMIMTEITGAVAISVLDCVGGKGGYHPKSPRGVVL